MYRALAGAVGIRGVVKKRREVVLIERTRVHLDEVEGLGSFVELEVVLDDDEPVSDGEVIARKLLQAINISDKNFIDCAYVDLLRGDEQPE